MFIVSLDAGIASSTVVMVAIYALFLLLVLTLVAGNAAKTAPSESVESVANDIVQQLDDFANQHGLSGKEREIMELLVTGAKRSDIEKQLGLSEGTVRTHISRMYRKLDVHSKGELVELFEASR